MTGINLPSIDCEQVADEIGQFIIDQCVHHTGAVIGLSGGVDSTLVAFLAKRAFDKKKWNNSSAIKRLNALKGYFISTNESSETSEKLAQKVADILEIEFTKIDIDNSIGELEQEFINCGIDISRNGFVVGNMISRHRGNVLWTIAGHEHKIVLGTGNADEDFGVGYYTLGGDGLVSCSPIGMLSKRLVYVMATWFKDNGFPQEIIDRKPTAELEINQTDEDDLGYKYILVEAVMECIKTDSGKENVVTLCYNYFPDISKILTTKWYNPQPEAKDREDLAQAIDDILKRHEGALYKARIVNPPKAKVTLT